MSILTVLLAVASSLIFIGVCLDIHHRDTTDYKWSEWRVWPKSMWLMLIGLILFFITLSIKINA